MKKSNLYYKTLFQRRNVILDMLLDFFLALSSWPRLLLETVLRTNMGERYFRLSTALWLVFILSILPLILFAKSRFQYSDNALGYFLKMYFTWYLYVGYFAYSAWQRHQEIKRLPGAFDFQRFSLSTGQIHERFRAFEFNGRRLSSISVACFMPSAIRRNIAGGTISSSTKSTSKSPMRNWSKRLSMAKKPPIRGGSTSMAVAQRTRMLGGVSPTCSAKPRKPPSLFEA